jgi:hypothetical protein
VTVLLESLPGAAEARTISRTGDNMNRRMYYAVKHGYSPMKHVLIVQPAGNSHVALYCPPGVAGGPWVENFPTMDQAMDLASNLAKEIGQLQVKTTASNIDWSQIGLTLIGDADDRDRQEIG